MVRATAFGIALVIVSVSPLTRGQQTAEPAAPAAAGSVMPAAQARAFADAAALRLDYLPGQVIVKFKDGVEAQGQQRALDALRGRPAVDRLQWIGDAALLSDPSQPDARVLAAALAAQPEVEYAEPNRLRRKSLTPNDTGYTVRQWNLQTIDMPHAWDLNSGGQPEVVVAVVDTGLTNINQTLSFKTWNGSAIESIAVPFATNPDLAASRLISAVDFVTSGGTTTLDMDGHGTHVTSTIGEDTNNTLLDAGIAYNARIMPVKVCASYWDVQFALSAAGIPGFADPDSGGCPLSAIAAGIRYAADNGAKVINLSLGGEGASQVEQAALQYALDKGVFIAIAAGNARLDGNPTQYPAAYGQAMQGVMAVGATTRSGKRASYSSTGPYIDIAAPGGDPLDSDAGGSGFIWQSTIRPSVSDPSLVLFPRFDNYAEVGYAGTSMASAHVAGVAALLYSQGITKPLAIEQSLKKTAKLLGAPSSSDPTRNDDVGAGLVQPRAALFGFGLRK